MTRRSLFPVLLDYCDGFLGACPNSYECVTRLQPRVHLQALMGNILPLQARQLTAEMDVDASSQVPKAAPVTIGIGNATWSGTPRIVSWHPMAIVFDNFATEEECDYLLKLSKPQMEPAMLVNSNEMKHVRSKSRTSHGTFFDSFGDEILAMITHRIAHVAKVPPGELLLSQARIPACR